MKDLWGVILLVGMAASFGDIGCALSSDSDNSTRLSPSPLGTRQGSPDRAEYRGLPVVRLSYVCSESSEFCIFRDGDFRNDANLDGGELSHIEFDSEIPLVPQAEYMIECRLRDSDDDWERSMLGAVVEECLFEVTLAAYPVDSEEVRFAGLQPEPVSPPVGVDPRSLAGNPDSPQAVVFLTSIIDELVSIEMYYVHYHVISDWNTSVLRSAKPGKWLSGQTSSGAMLPPAAFPPGPSRTHMVQTIEETPPPSA